MLVRVLHTYATNVWGCLSASCMLVDKHTFLERGFDGTFCTDATAPGKPYCRDDRSGMVAVASDLASADRSRVRGCDRRHPGLHGAALLPGCHERGPEGRTEHA